jgi:hypothetical protein
VGGGSSISSSQSVTYDLWFTAISVLESHGAIVLPTVNVLKCFQMPFSLLLCFSSYFLNFR